jgi:hypothetical protein
MTQRRPEVTEYAARLARYVEMVPETDIAAALLEQLEATRAFLGSLPEQVHDHRYAEGKWTIREVLGHILDTERIFGFRLLRIARGDASAITRTDENLYVRNGQFGRFTMGELLEEFALVRRANVMLVERMPEEAWERTGVVADAPVSARAVAYLMVGHERHHLQVVRERYL